MIGRTPIDHESILLTKDLCGITIWIRKHKDIYPVYRKIIKKRISTLTVRISPRNINECKSTDINTFMDVILQLSTLKDEDIELLHILSNNVIVPNDKSTDVASSNHITIYNKVILMALLENEKIRDSRQNAFEDKNVIYFFLQSVIDLYIPSHNPESLINAITDNMSLTDMVIHAYDTQWMIKKYKYFEQSTSLKEVILIHKIICDIFNYTEERNKFIRGVHHILNTKIYLERDIEKLYLKYKRYLKEYSDARFFIISIFTLLGTGMCYYDKRLGSSELSENIRRFLEDFSYEFSPSLPTEYMKYLLMDAAQIIIDHDLYELRKESIQYISRQILSEWGNEKYNIQEAFMESYLSPEDTPITILDELTRSAELMIATEGKEVSAKMNSAEKKIYNAYKTYKGAEEKVDAQITKGVNGVKGVLTGEFREQIIEGKKFSAIGLLKKLLAGLAIFSYSKIKFAALLVIRYALKKKTTDAERSKILMEIDTEIEMLDEKINDARGDNNRKAKYCMMRTRKELENAKVRIQYGLSADQKSLTDTRKTLDNARAERTVR